MKRDLFPDYRTLLYQAILLAMVTGLAFAIFHTTQTNLERLGVHSGFDFLWLRAGFEIGQSVISYTPDSPIIAALWVAFLNTLLLAVVSICLSTFLGFAIGICRLSGNWLLSQAARAYVEIFRNIPVLLQIFFWYFIVLRALPDTQNPYSLLEVMFLSNRGLFLPSPVLKEGFGFALALVVMVFVARLVLHRWMKQRRVGIGRPVWRKHALAGLTIALLMLFVWIAGSHVSWEIPRLGRFGYQGGMVLTPEFVALAFGLAIYNASYIAEIVRSAIQSIPRGLVEAAESLGLRNTAILRLITLPLALRVIMPPLTTVYLNIFKSTSLAAAIAYPDVMSVFVGTVNNLIGQPLEIMTVTLLSYAFVAFALSLLMHLYGKKQALKSGEK